MAAEPSATGKRSNWRARALAWALVLLATAVLYRQPLFEGAEFEAWDQARVYVPLQVANARSRSAGVLPLWFRNGFLGYPLQAEGECGGAYPPALVFNLISDPGTAWNVFLLMHLLLAIDGMMRLLRVLGAGIAGQAAAALVFVFGGSFVGELPQATLITTLAWTPCVLWLLLVSCRDRSWWPAALGGLVLAAQVSGGHPQVVFYTLLLVLLLVLCEVRGDDRWKRLWFAARAGTVTVAVGLCLAAPQLLYCLESMALTDRGGGLDHDQQVEASLPPHYLLQLLVANPGGSSHRANLLWMNLRVYLGLLPLWLVVVGWRRGGPAARMFRLAIVLGIVLALGRYSGIDLLIGGLPGFRSLNVPARFLLVVSLAAAVLAGLGLDHLTRGRRSVAWSAITAFTLLAVAAIAVGVTASEVVGPVDGIVRTWQQDDVFVREWNRVSLESRTEGLARAGWQAGLVAAACAGCCWWLTRGGASRPAIAGALALIAVDLVAARTVPGTARFLQQPDGLWRVAPSRQDYEYDNPQRTLAGLPDNTAGLYGIDCLAINPGARSALLRRVFETASQKTHALMNVRFVLVDREITELESRLQFSDGEWWIYEVPGWRPRASVCEQFRVVSDPNAVDAVIRDAGFVLGKSVVIDRSPEFTGGDAIDEPMETPTATVKSHEAQRVVIEARLPRRGILVLADLDDPGWRATSNGREIDILRANGAVRGLALGPGRHAIEFVYRPRGVRIGLVISAGMMLGLMAWGILVALRRRPDETGQVSNLVSHQDNLIQSGSAD